MRQRAAGDRCAAVETGAAPVEGICAADRRSGPGKAQIGEVSGCHANSGAIGSAADAIGRQRCASHGELRRLFL